MSDRKVGTVKWFNDAKGFGFISPDDGSADLFVHFKSITGTGFKTLKEGQKVNFNVTQGQKGLQADDVKPE
ncbi:MAG: cold-shock protein [Rhodanobacter sp.]